MTMLFNNLFFIGCLKCLIYCYAGPCSHTGSTAVTDTLLPKAAAQGGWHNTGTLLGETSWLARGSEVTDPQTSDLLREAGRQLKAQHNFLTLLVRNRVNTGGIQGHT